MKLVIYTRYSSEMQRAESCEDQERKVREGLTRLRIDPSGAEVIHDEAVSGTRADRAGFTRLIEMIRAGEPFVLAVDDQSRFSRADSASSLITDLVYAGGRFISTGEGIDTDQTGWELRVKVMELHHGTTIRELGRRVRRGQEGRALDVHGSVGDCPFGYRTRLVDPNSGRQTSRGPKPKKENYIYDSEAQVVREIFASFIAERSISAMVRELNRRNIDKGHRSSQRGWHHYQVRRMLSNPKYVGIWSWGATTTKRDSQGRKKQVPLPMEQVIRTNRPDLRIIDQATWEKAQARLHQCRAAHAALFRPRHEGERVHHTTIYPRSLLGGLVSCGSCGAPMNRRGTHNKYLGCRGYSRGLCTMGVGILIGRCEERLIAFVCEVLKGEPGWIEAVIRAARQRLSELSSRVPGDAQRDEKRLVEAKRQINNVVDALANGSPESAALNQRLKILEQDEADITRRIEEQQQLARAQVRLPDDEEIFRQLQDLIGLLRGDVVGAARLLRKLLEKVTAHPVTAPGKRRGFVQLRFRINNWAALESVLENTLPRSVLNLIVPTSGEDSVSSPEFQLDLGEPSQLDRLAPKIVEMREARVTWNEISRITGLSLGNAWTACNRLTKAKQGGADAA